MSRTVLRAAAGEAPAADSPFRDEGPYRCRCRLGTGATQAGWNSTPSTKAFREFSNFAAVHNLSQDMNRLPKIILFKVPREFITVIWRIINLTVRPRFVRDAFSINYVELKPKVEDVEFHIRQEIVSILKHNLGINNLLELYGQCWLQVYFRFFILNGKLQEWWFWIIFTSGLRKFSVDRLEKYYNKLTVSNYCGFLRLNNYGWILHRFEQFKIMKELGINPAEKIYLEFGGSTGLIAFAARLFGFSSVSLVDVTRRDLEFARILFSKIVVASSIHVSEQVENEDTFDVISCHQVIEHTNEPEIMLTRLYGYLNPGGLLFISTGYHVFPHPGHFYLEKEDFEKLMEKIGFQKFKKQPIQNYSYLYYREG